MSALCIRGLRASHGDREILRGIDLDVTPGEIVMLMGASGGGKSTTLRSIAALQSFTAGTITIGDFTLRPGRTPGESALRPLRQRVGMVFQQHALFEHLTALDNITLAPMHALGWSRERATDVAHTLLRTLGIDPRANAHPRELSGGEQQRVAIARALAPDPLVLLMDEPTSALDPERRAALGGTLGALAHEGRALLVSTHDAEFAERVADRVVRLVEGSIAEVNAV